MDCPADATDDSVSAMFRDILPKGSIPPYDNDAALLVEEVLRVMHKPYQPEWWILVAHYGTGMPHREIADKLCIARSTVTRHRLPMARRIFGEQWDKMVRKISPFQGANNGT